jgi:hypothetical protein
LLFGRAIAAWGWLVSCLLALGICRNFNTLGSIHLFVLLVSYLFVFFKYISNDFFSLCGAQILELKKHHQAGGRSVYTWQKQPNDKWTAGLAGIIFTAGTIQLVIGHYRLATGKGKME